MTLGATRTGARHDDVAPEYVLLSSAGKILFDLFAGHTKSPLNSLVLADVGKVARAVVDTHFAALRGDCED